MGFFNDIFNGVFGGKAKAAEPKAGEPAATAPAPAPTAEKPAAPGNATVIPVPNPTPGNVTEVSPAPTSAGTATSVAVGVVDVAEVLDAKVKAGGQKLDWRKSIVDLMKALGIDSSLTARKALADELGYTGDKSDSATMNVWLHKQVIKKLADNGGVVPADLLD